MSKSGTGILDRMNEKETEELLIIWEENNRDEWSSEVFKTIGDVLTERGISLPPQANKDKEQKSGKGTSSLRSTSLNILGIWLVSSILMGFIRPNLPNPFKIGPISLNLLVFTDLLLTGLLVSGIICFILSFFKKGNKEQK